jgi:hypothetical protein
MLLPLAGTRSFGCPVLVIGGAKDKSVPLAHVRKTAAALSATLAVLDDAAHDLILDIGWENAAARARNWLENSAPGHTAATRAPSAASAAGANHLRYARNLEGQYQLRSG